jgi:hypothetical protein
MEKGFEGSGCGFYRGIFFKELGKTTKTLGDESQYPGEAPEYKCKALPLDQPVRLLLCIAGTAEQGNYDGPCVKLR